MADKPSRALVIFGDGLAPLILSSHGNLHEFASRAACGFLSLRDSANSENEDESFNRDLAQLLYAYDFFASEKSGEAGANADFQTLSERFMGLSAAMITSCPSIKSFVRKLGFSILNDDDLVKQDDSRDETLEEHPKDYSVVSKLLHCLGFSGSNVLDKYDFDLIFWHFTTSDKPIENKEKLVSNMDANGLNDVVGEIMAKAHPESVVGSRLHLSIVLSYGYASEGEELYSLLPSPSADMNSDLSLLCPLQSYSMKGGHRLNNIRHHHPMLVAQLQVGITRRDKAKAFFFEEFKENGANLAILSDRLLHEIAFKLWKAPKYGA